MVTHPPTHPPTHTPMKDWRQTLFGREFKILTLHETARAGDALDTPDRVARYLRERMTTSPRWNADTENLIVVALTTRLKPIGFEIVSNGTLDTILCHPREVFKPAIVLGAGSIVMAHNHPSGDCSPSEADIRVTREMLRAGALLKIALKDHLILGQPDYRHPGDPGYVSLLELGYLYDQ